MIASLYQSRSCGAGKEISLRFFPLLVRETNWGSLESIKLLAFSGKHLEGVYMQRHITLGLVPLPKNADLRNLSLSPI